MSENSLLYGAIGVGLTITGFGITYVIDYEKRISLLESRLNALTGISAVSPSTTPSDGPNIGENAQTDRVEEDGIFGRAIAEGCLRLITSYDDIISEGTIYSNEQERLDALKAQMDSLGCTVLGIPK